jgi:hypothetical protein
MSPLHISVMTRDVREVVKMTRRGSGTRRDSTCKRLHVIISPRSLDSLKVHCCVQRLVMCQSRILNSFKSHFNIICSDVKGVRHSRAINHFPNSPPKSLPELQSDAPRYVCPKALARQSLTICPPYPSSWRLSWSRLARMAPLSKQCLLQRQQSAPHRAPPEPYAAHHPAASS